MPTLSPEQLNKLSEISNPLVRRRFSVFYQLPSDLQESMLAESTAENIWNLIKEKYQLPETSISATAKIIGLIFLGELPIKNFIVALKDELGIDVQKAAAIAQDINQTIFQPVRESLMQVHGLERGLTQNKTRINADNNQQIPTRPPSTLYPPQSSSREELMARLKSQNPPAMQPPPQNKPPFQARPAHYYAIPRKNVIDLRTGKRKNKKNKYKGFFASY